MRAAEFPWVMRGGGTVEGAQAGVRAGGGLSCGRIADRACMRDGLVTSIYLTCMYCNVLTGQCTWYGTGIQIRGKCMERVLVYKILFSYRPVKALTLTRSKKSITQVFTVHVP